MTLSLDGAAREVTTMGDTVGDVLEAEGIEVGEHDVVAPGLDEAVTDGTRIAVRFGRPLDLDRRRRDHDPLGHRDRRRRRPGPDRQPLRRRRAVGQPRRHHRPRGHEPEVVTPKNLDVAVAGQKVVTRKVARR